MEGEAQLIQLGAEWALTVLVLLGSGLLIFLHHDTGTDSAAIALVTMVVGYWFGRSFSRQ